jgi:hypothetical protein
MEIPNHHQLEKLALHVAYVPAANPLTMPVPQTLDPAGRPQGLYAV